MGNKYSKESRASRAYEKEDAATKAELAAIPKPNNPQKDKETRALFTQGPQTKVKLIVRPVYPNTTSEIEELQALIDSLYPNDKSQIEEMRFYEDWGVYCWELPLSLEEYDTIKVHPLVSFFYSESAYYWYVRN